MGRRWIFGLICVLAAGALIGGCEKSQADLAVPKYTESDGSIRVRKGRQFMLVLKANREEGYRWVLARPFDTKVLRLISASYWIPMPADEGESGEERWTFRGLEKGETTIELNYVLPDQPEENPPKVNFEVTVR